MYCCYCIVSNLYVLFFATIFLMNILVCQVNAHTLCSVYAVSLNSRVFRTASSAFIQYACTTIARLFFPFALMYLYQCSVEHLLGIGFRFSLSYTLYCLLIRVRFFLIFQFTFRAACIGVGYSVLPLHFDVEWPICEHIRVCVRMLSIYVLRL